MGFWDDLKTKFNDVNESVKTSVAKFNNEKFANASMAMCALVAAADGEIDKDERKKTAKFIQKNEALKVFDPADLKKRFDHYCDELEDDYDFGEIEALGAMEKLKGNRDQATACVKVGIIIGKADGDFDDDEQEVVRKACKAMDLPASEFGL